MDRAAGIRWGRRIKKAMAAVALGIAACLILAWLCGYIVVLPSDDLAAVQKDRKRLDHEYWEPLRVVAPDGTAWFIPSPRDDKPTHACWYIKDGLRHAGGDFAPAEWDYFWNQAAAMLPDGRPVAVWCGSRKGPNAPTPEYGWEVAAAFYTGEGWSTPDILAGGVTPNGLDVAVDKDGRVHVVFTAQLQPPEDYGFMDSFYAGKAWHAMYDGRRWSEAKPLQGRGHYNVDRPILTAAPSGRLIFSADVREEFSLFGSYVGAQVLDESYSGRPGRLMPGLW